MQQRYYPVIMCTIVGLFLPAESFHHITKTASKPTTKRVHDLLVQSLITSDHIRSSFIEPHHYTTS